MTDQEVKEYVKKRYSEIAEAGNSCCGPSCGCGSSTLDAALQLGYSKEELENIPETSNLGLGCGNPTALAGLNIGETVLDLGSGAGIDAFLAAQKVGPKGKVIGVDMTKEMIKKAQATAKDSGYENIEFRLGEIENLPVEDNTIDVIISNCVINLSPDKEKVYREAYRVLKSKGRMLISDIVTEEELPEDVKKSFDAWAGCVAGALEKPEYLEIIKKSGFNNVNIVSESTFDFDVFPEIKGKITSLQVEAHKS